MLLVSYLRLSTDAIVLTNLRRRTVRLPLAASSKSASGKRISPAFGRVAPLVAGRSRIRPAAACVKRASRSSGCRSRAPSTRPLFAQNLFSRNWNWVRTAALVDARFPADFLATLRTAFLTAGFLASFLLASPAPFAENSRPMERIV